MYEKPKKKMAVDKSKRKSSACGPVLIIAVIIIVIVIVATVNASLEPFRSGAVGDAVMDVLEDEAVQFWESDAVDEIVDPAVETFVDGLFDEIFDQAE